MKLLQLFVATALAAVPVLVNGQTPVESDTLAEAEQLRNSVQLVPAATLLQAYWANHTGDANTARLYGETLYWLKRFGDARAVYEVGVRANPGDLSLALSYGRMLINTGGGARARTVLAPFQDSVAAIAPISTLLGTLSYWDGDLVAATRFFRKALLANPDERDAARQLEEIRVLTASWLRFGGDSRFDDQPLHRVSGSAEAGKFLTELVSLSARARPMYFELGDSVTRTLTHAEGELDLYSPATHLDVSLAAGGLSRSYDTSSDWTGRGVLGLRMPHHIVFRLRAERAPYLYSLASLTNPVMTRTFSFSADWNDPAGWMGRALVQRELFPDANAVATIYAWLLAPLFHSPGADIQLGASAAAQDADESRFALARPVQPYPPGDSRFSTAGIYQPYYTPSSLSYQSVIGAVTLHTAPGVTLRGGGGYAIRASDSSPSFIVSPGTGNQPATLQRVFQARTFSLWNARASIEAALTQQASITAGAQYDRTAFYSATTAEAAITYRFHGRSER